MTCGFENPWAFAIALVLTAIIAIAPIVADKLEQDW